jgi:hypothetical protein
MDTSNCGGNDLASRRIDTQLPENTGIEGTEKDGPQELLLPEDLDSRRAPPRDLRDVFKRYSRATLLPEDSAKVSDSADLREPQWTLQEDISEEFMGTLLQQFQDGDSMISTPPLGEIGSQMHSASVYQSNVIPGRGVSFSIQLLVLVAVLFIFKFLKLFYSLVF